MPCPGSSSGPWERLSFPAGHLGRCLYCLNDLDLPFSLPSITGVFLQPPTACELLTTPWWFLLSQMQYKTSLTEASSRSRQHFLLLLWYLLPKWPIDVLTLLSSMATIPMALLVPVFDILQGIVAVCLDVSFGVCVFLYPAALLSIKLVKLDLTVSAHAPYFQ